MCSRKRNLLVGCITLPRRVTRLTLASGPVRYLAWSAVSFVSNVGLSFALYDLVQLPGEAAFLLALLLMFVVNFLGLRYFVYRSFSAPPLGQFGKYALSAAGFRLSEYLAFLAAHTVLGSPYRPTVVGVLIVSFLFKYVFYRRFVFHRR